MATLAGLVSVEEYLRTTYKPACEYKDGVLQPKAMPTYDHGALQGQFCRLIPNAQFAVATELTVRIREGRWLVPDVAVQLKSKLQRPYPIEPILLCIEILSPEDRFSAMLAKCDEYLEWGVAMTWIVDPESRRAWEYSGRAPREVPPGGSLTAGADIAVPLNELFSVLD